MIGSQVSDQTSQRAKPSLCKSAHGSPNCESAQCRVVPGSPITAYDFYFQKVLGHELGYVKPNLLRDLLAIRDKN